MSRRLSLPVACAYRRTANWFHVVQDLVYQVSIMLSDKGMKSVFWDKLKDLVKDRVRMNVHRKSPL